MPDSSDSFLMGGGKKSASFPTPGTTVSGTITRVGDPQQQRDPATGIPKTWPNGDPQLQLPVDLQTSDRLDAQDDGARTLYISGIMRNAVRDAVRAAGADGLRVGGTLAVTFTHQDAPERAGLSGLKHYSATYAPPSDGFLSGAEPGTGTATGANATLITTVPSGSTTTDEADPVQVAKSLMSLGQPDGVIAQATGLAPAVVAALRNTVAA